MRRAAMSLVLTFRQHLSDPSIVQALGATEVERRYLV